MFANIWKTVKSWWSTPQPLQQPGEPLHAATMPVSVIGDTPVVAPEKTPVVETKPEVTATPAQPVKSVSEPEPVVVNSSLPPAPVATAVEVAPLEPAPVTHDAVEKPKKTKDTKAKATKTPKASETAKTSAATTKKSPKGKSATT